MPQREAEYKLFFVVVSHFIDSNCTAEYIGGLPGGQGDGRPSSVAYFVPEPASLALLGVGGGLMLLRRQRQR